MNDYTDWAGLSENEPAVPGVLIVLIVALPSTAILLLRFRKRWLAAFNIVVTNRFTGLFAVWFPGLGMIAYRGGKSGRLYCTPVNVFRTHKGFIVALTYGRHAEWVKHVLAAGGCQLENPEDPVSASTPAIVHDPQWRQFPAAVRMFLKLVGADEFIEFSIASGAATTPSC
jgi:deazaflavin-dependent oxidoreductase (nitroreductase family)